MPTSQSVMAKFITKQFVTVRNRLVVNTDSITRVFPITVMKINKRHRITIHPFSHGKLKNPDTDGCEVMVVEFPSHFLPQSSSPLPDVRFQYGNVLNKALGSRGNSVVFMLLPRTWNEEKTQKGVL